eukprot:7188282-Alexandrium_andersonii.AAC.1
MPETRLGVRPWVFSDSRSLEGTQPSVEGLVIDRRARTLLRIRAAPGHPKQTTKMPRASLWAASGNVERFSANK